MYRRSNESNGLLRLLGGVVIIVGAVIAFTIYQQSSPARTVLPTPTTVEATPTTIPPSPQPTASNDVRLRIVSPKASLSTAITKLYFTRSGENWDLTYLDNFAGHLEGTAELGMGGNFVLAGHVELGDGRPGPFKFIGNLKKDDEIMIYSETPEKPFIVRYKVTAVKEVEPTEISVIRNHGFEELTLITCDDWDQESGEYLTRVIVHAKPY